MVCNEFIRCEVCGCITRIRLQVGWLDEHPIAVTCGKCGISLKGKVKIGQDTPGLKFEFENAERVNATLASVQENSQQLRCVIGGYRKNLLHHL